MSSKSFTIFGRQGCKYCQLSMQLLERHNLTYQYVDVGDEYQRKLLLSMLKGLGITPTTVPQIIYTKGVEEEVYVGGYEDLRKILCEEPL